MPNPTFLQALDARRSVPSKQLSAPGPDDSTLLRMLTAASRVPDHGKLVPFRFLRISGDARHALGEALAARTLALNPKAELAARQAALRALIEARPPDLQKVCASLLRVRFLNTIAARGLVDFGTIEAGKRADLLVLDADPLSDISNLRKLSVVMRDGKVIDRDRLPLERVLSR